jgi:hypothetical protein
LLGHDERNFFLVSEVAENQVLVTVSIRWEDGRVDAFATEISPITLLGKYEFQISVFLICALGG